ncbi:protein yippee-like 1 isoform X1 [Acinonyx jubatus]|uniref:Protein yippee-like 1 isoform X1 n=1 Tax=Acinonyx jubatus TaxID=32536 RepID=A0A6J1YLX0_ACIJB|nr:protein yippee-like 1 isoform X1 [Acinonyx jubatus]
MVKMTKSKTFQAYLPNCHRTYSCVHCRAHLANHDELISKSFQGSQGRAYLFNSVVNVGCGPAEERVLLTGLHAVADIYCENCKTTLGWKYALGWICSQSGLAMPWARCMWSLGAAGGTDQWTTARRFAPWSRTVKLTCTSLLQPLRPALCPLCPCEVQK